MTKKALATDRLSWLQKGILVLALEMGGHVYRRDIYIRLYGFTRTRACLRNYFSPDDIGSKYKAATVAVSNALKRLEIRGLVLRKPFWGVHLTPAGLEAGKDLAHSD
jgi:hypothetical protein